MGNHLSFRAAGIGDAKKATGPLKVLQDQESGTLTYAQFNLGLLVVTHPPPPPPPSLLPSVGPESDGVKATSQSFSISYQGKLLQRGCASQKIIPTVGKKLVGNVLFQ